jgi:DNA-binding NtrC family response regulator
VAIIVTAYAASETADAALQAGAWQILPKPVEFPRLMSFIDEASEQPLVLVVDDDEDLCETLWDVFRENKYRVCLAHTAQEAADRLRGRDHRVVLIDMKLPEGNGGDVLRLVREIAPTARTVLIAGYRGEMEQLIGQVLSEGADEVCYKPFDVAKLLETVNKLAQ